MSTWLIAVIVIVALIVLWFVSTYNASVKFRNKLKDQCSQIDVQLKRRFNIIETVKGNVKYEKSTLEDVIKARNTFTTTTTPEEEMKASGKLTKCLSKLMKLTESYSELKANENLEKSDLINIFKYNITTKTLIKNY